LEGAVKGEDQKEFSTFWLTDRNVTERTSSTRRSRANQPGFVVSGEKSG